MEHIALCMTRIAPTAKLEMNLVRSTGGSKPTCLSSVPAVNIALSLANMKADGLLLTRQSNPS